MFSFVCQSGAASVENKRRKVVSEEEGGKIYLPDGAETFQQGFISVKILSTRIFEKDKTIFFILRWIYM